MISSKFKCIFFCSFFFSNSFSIVACYNFNSITFKGCSLHYFFFGFILFHLLRGQRSTRVRWTLSKIVVSGEKKEEGWSYNEDIQDMYRLTLEFLKWLKLYWSGNHTFERLIHKLRVLCKWNIIFNKGKRKGRGWFATVIMSCRILTLKA